MIIKFLTSALRRFFVDFQQDFTFRKVDLRKFKIPELKETSLYIHIPFCKSMCPYCPYNKVEYKSELVKPYIDSLLKEIELYAKELGKIRISSIYIGGGTPTNVIDELGAVLEKIRKEFQVTGDIAIETTVSDISEYVVKKLSSYGVTLVSLGVQSFSERHLKTLGRNYSQKDILPAIELLKSYNFDTINLDLMFAFSCQTKKEVLRDFRKAVKTSADQITAYPLFTFPYSSVGEFKKIKKVKMPDILLRRTFYKLIHQFLLSQGFKRFSVWGFKRGEGKRYSSVTRNYYIGLGAGAGSSLPGKFYFNTFLIEQYNKRLSEGFLPIALNMDVSKKLAYYYRLYWKLYDTFFTKEEIKQLFSNNRRARFFLRALKAMGLCKNYEDGIALTEKGAFWIHLAQNYFILEYINKVWSAMKKEAFPDAIEI